MRGEFGLRGLEHCEGAAGTTEVDQAAAVSRNMLVVAGAEAEEVAELVIAATEPLRRSEALEPPHTSCAPFDAAVVLLQPVILVRAGPVHDMTAERRADRPRVRSGMLMPLFVCFRYEIEVVELA